MAKPPTRHQLDMALAAIHQVSGFLTDGGFDPDGTKAASLGAAAESLELVRKHWTTETRRKAERPAEAPPALYPGLTTFPGPNTFPGGGPATMREAADTPSGAAVDDLSAGPVTLIPEGQDKPAARNAPDPERPTETLPAEAAARNAPQSRN